MRTVKNGLLVLLTLALVAAGALLPYAVAQMQDRRLESAGDTRELSQVQLLIQQDLSPAQVLNILGGEYTRMAWDSETNLSAAQALTYACDAVELMVLENLLPQSAYPWYESDGSWSYPEWNGDISAFLVISNGENREALLLWECTWESPADDAAYTIWIDDETGMMYGINRTWDNDYVDGVVDVKYLDQYMDQWAFFLRDYYDFEIVDEVRAQEASDDGIREWEAFILTLTVQDAEETVSTCTVRLTLQGWSISFIC